MAITDNITGIPDDEFFAVKGKLVKDMLEILKEISTNDRNRLFNLRYRNVQKLFNEIRDCEQVKVEHKEAKEITV